MWNHRLFGPEDPVGIIYQGLQRLEYRGYDSAGIAVIHDEGFGISPQPGKLHKLGEILARDPLGGR